MTGLVVARFRNTAEVEQDGKRRMCLLKGKRVSLVVGDRVRLRSPASGRSVISDVLPRDNELTRINSAGQPELVAANIDQIVVVVAAKPTPDWFLVDRYLCAAELMAATATVVFNKVDLVTDGTPRSLEQYGEIGYATSTTSAKGKTGLAELSARLANHRSVLVGQSGVGKSSLLNALVPEAEERVAELSAKTAQGRHTTSTAVLHRLPGGGELIDSPGVRDYAPFIADFTEVARGFPEFAPFVADCRFANCRHLEEPGCAVKGAVESRLIQERRYASFVRLTQLTRELTRTNGPG